jgi:hypothetical protein
MKSKQKKEHHFLEAALQNAEVAVDLVTTNEIVKAIPVLGTGVKLLKGVGDMRARAFAAKLAAFVSSLEQQSVKAKTKIKKRLSASPDEARKVGENLFLVLERMTDLEKPELLAKVFLAFLDGVISSDELRRLACAIDAAFVEDLERLASASESELFAAQNFFEEWCDNLLPSGLMGTRTEVSTGSRVVYVSRLGEVFRRAMVHLSAG